MRYLWDPAKCRENIRKHSIDFADVPCMFEYPMLATVDKRRDYGEDRWVGIGFLKGIIAVVVFTEDDDRQIRRIISTRKASKYEQARFKEKIGN
jgi:uncharacterized DUF497 family protein